MAESGEDPIKSDAALPDGGLGTTRFDVDITPREVMLGVGERF